MSDTNDPVGDLAELLIVLREIRDVVRSATGAEGAGFEAPHGEAEAPLRCGGCARCEGCVRCGGCVRCEGCVRCGGCVRCEGCVRCAGCH
jgi:hypothetical protein